MMKIQFDEDEVLSLEYAANEFAVDYEWKDGWTVDAKKGEIHFKTQKGEKCYIGLSGFCYREKDRNKRNPKCYDEYNVNFCEDLNINNLLFGKNEDGEWVIVHD